MNVWLVRFTPVPRGCGALMKAPTFRCISVFRHNYADCRANSDTSRTLRDTGCYAMAIHHMKRDVSIAAL